MAVPGLGPGMAIHDEITTKAPRRQEYDSHYLVPLASLWFELGARFSGSRALLPQLLPVRQPLLDLALEAAIDGLIEHAARQLVGEMALA